MNEKFIRMIEVVIAAIPTILSVCDRIIAFVNKKKNDR